MAKNNDKFLKDQSFAFQNDKYEVLERNIPYIS